MDHTSRVPVSGARRRQWSISARLFALQLAAIAVIGAAVMVIVSLDAKARVDSEAATRSLVIATAISENPFVVENVQSDDPTTRLQPYAAELVRTLSVDFVTIMAPDGIRYTHRDPAQIGKVFVGNRGPALAGQSFTETFTGTLGPSVRAVVPIESNGTIVALVAVGITVENLADVVAERLPAVLAIVLVMAALAALASWVLARYLRRVTGGLGPEEIGRMFAYYESVLHSVREGLVLVDPHGRIVLSNDQAAELLGLGTDQVPVDAADSGIAAPLADLFVDGRTAVDEIYVANGRVLVVNQQPARSPGDGPTRTYGTVVTLRDRTELQQLAGELASMRTLSDALRSQTHEFSNRMHTIVSLIELGRADEALKFASGEHSINQQLADEVVGSVGEPALAALLLGKSAQARERSIDFDIDVPAPLEPTGLDTGALVTILGNLIDNALDAAPGIVDSAGAGAGAGAGAWVEVYLGTDDDGALVMQVSDSGPGLDEDAAEHAFTRGFSTKEHGETGRGIGLALVQQAVRDLGGTIEVGGEHASTFTVQVPSLVGSAGSGAGAGADAGARAGSAR